MTEHRELFRLLDAAGRQLTFPEEALPHEGSRRLLEFLGVKIVKTNEQIDAGLTERFGERELTVRCQPCEWVFTGPTTAAIAEQRTHSESAAHGRKLLELVDRGESVRLPKARGETMDDKCRVCKKESAPPRGMYAGIGAACRAEGYVNKAGQIVKQPRQHVAVGGGQSGGLPLPGLPKPAPKPEPEPEIDVPVERKPTPEPQAVSDTESEPSLNARVGRWLAAGEALGKVLVRHEQELAEARAEFDAASAELPA